MQATLHHFCIAFLPQHATVYFKQFT